MVHARARHFGPAVRAAQLRDAREADLPLRQPSCPRTRGDLPESGVEVHPGRSSGFSFAWNAVWPLAFCRAHPSPPGPLVPWSLGPLVPWSLGPLAPWLQFGLIPSLAFGVSIAHSEQSAVISLAQA